MVQGHDSSVFKHGHTSWCCRFTSVRLSRLITLLLLVLVLVPLFTHYYLSKFMGDLPASQTHQKGVQLDDLNSARDSDLKVRIEEMMRIKTSVSSELRVLESRRQKLQSEIASLSQKVEHLKSEYSRHQIEMERLQLSIQQVQYAQREAQEKNVPYISAPKRILPSLEDQHHVNPPSLQSSSLCRTHLCFDYSRCSLTSGFPVYFYHPDDYRLSWNQLEKFVKTAVTEALNMNVHITFDPNVACVFVVLVGEVQGDKLSTSDLEHYLQNLGHWNGDGRNHILLNFARTINATDIFAGVNTGRAMIVQSHFSAAQYRLGFDIVVPPLVGLPYGDVWEGLPSISPARRKYLMSYQGEYKAVSPDTNLHRTRNILAFNNSSSNKNMFRNNAFWQAKSHLSTDTKVDDEWDDNEEKLSEDFIIDSLKTIQINGLNDKFILQFSCSGKIVHRCIDGEWCLCDSYVIREQMLSQSTFNLILTPSNFNILSTPQLQLRLFEALKYGAIPVVLGNQVVLPFNEVIDWNSAVLILPKARVTELHFLLRTITDSDISSLRMKGRLLWERYAATTQQIINTVLAVVRHRIQLPPPAVQDENSASVFNSTFQPIVVEVAAIQDVEAEENLGPLEPALPSPQFQRNFTYFLVNQHHVWNEAMDPFTLYPYTPFDPILPAEAKFVGSNFGFRPVGQGAGGAGKEFSESLGGNNPREQFTVVMLTYEREAVLIDSLQRLHGLPFLNKVLVVWNSPKAPSADLRWPELGVPIHVVKAKKNSLNNRFLPFDAIETEAVLSMDDDAHLRHDEIVFSFRVWREARDRIVGLPGRYHAWDVKYGGWLYNSNYSCELSMVLTGAAFFHKYYSYLYTSWMPQAIRDKVDEYMNCEDIAMNLLVSHITRKPPIKVTSRWTFRCPGCPVALSEEDSHFHERHKCINFFAQVYGYMPLLNTQFRADSVLFKTRIPHDKQKCFKFI